MDPPSRDAVMLAINHLMELVKYCFINVRAKKNLLEPWSRLVRYQTVLVVQVWASTVP